MSSEILTSVLSIALAAGSGASPPFLRFAAAPVIYPPIILAFLAIGVANLIASIAR